MKRLPSNDRALVVLGAVAVAALLSVVLVLLPMHRRARQLSRQVGTLRKKIADAESMYHRLPKETARAADLTKRISSSCRAEIDPSPEVVREIEQLTSDLGLHLAMVRPSEPAPTESYTKLATTFDVQASFANIVRLLYELETPPHNLWVDGVEISSDQAGAELRASVTVAVYVYTPADRKADAKT